MLRKETVDAWTLELIKKDNYFKECNLAPLHYIKIDLLSDSSYAFLKVLAVWYKSYVVTR
jgi:hypothetical protein